MSAGAPVRSGPRFETAYGPVRPGEPALGEISLLPWDAEIFRFPVAFYRPAPSGISRGPAALREALQSWTSASGAELVGCRVPAEATATAANLAAAGFRFVELQLRATIPRLEAARLDARRLTVRSAEPADRARILETAESAFTFGRYHADPLFPRALAARRFRVWMERALTEPVPGTWIGVLGAPGQPAGFVHAEQEGEQADIRLLASDAANGGLAGPALLLGALHELSARGATRVTAQLSPANSAALNVYAANGFQFHRPEVILHWSRPGAPHLLAAPPA